ncbi:MAG: cytochrome c1 [Sphingomonadaceae bacterium]|uniref:cytochrome c1 n=1 Tax=Thermaurantiacus sp. TaxID=2820283 RepID=UPI00298F30C5|nr:cytochrome c1 [Thermaurantiacus sp.]MCS6986802.1 cytochrome c1 [Sphingomonadaceae bacterium]MDW8413935.1 cytochrome c1 [Thermaurantiacus sp.]
MVRLVGMALGLVFCFVLAWAFLVPREATQPDPVKLLHREPKEVSWPHTGPFGKFDRAQLQRGFQVYKEVCSSCHGLYHVHYRDLEKIGFTPAQVKAIAAEYEVPAIDPNTGETITRPALPTDKFYRPFPNEQAARAANNNAYPPDLSLIIKARKNGESYVYSLLTGYGEEPPPGFEVPDGLNYNPYFHSVNIAMAQPLVDGQVEYADGTPATVDQMAKDVVAFLRWAAEPELEVRRRVGLASLLFLSILAVLSYLTYRRVWADVKP